MTLYFDHTIVKVRKDGVQVMGSTLEPGERLINGQTYKELAGAAPEVVTVEITEPGKSAAEEAEEAAAAAHKEAEEAAEAQRKNEEEQAAAAAAETEEEAEEAETEEEAEEAETAERPKDSDNKDAWFAYAQSKGFEGTKDDLTTKQFIEQFGA